MATDHDELDPRLRAAIDGLTDREPATDLWPGIARRITRRRPGTVELRWPIAAAAAVALVVGGAVVSRQFLPGTEAPVVAAIETPAEGTPVLPAGYDRAEATLSEAIDQLERAYRAEAATLDPEVRQAIASSLEALDTAIRDARERAGAAPTDLDAAKYLTRTMQRKLSVLRTAATMASAS